MRSPANQIRMNGRGAARHYRVVVAALIAAVVSFTAGCQFGRQHSSSPDPSAIGPLLATSSSSSRAAHTLVVYIFSKTDTEYENNMRFFLRWGVAADDGCDYVIIIQTMGEGMKVLELPPLPRNVRVEYHPNGCYDWGTIGWLLDSDKVDVRPYKYFIFMNSSVRGPFLPVFNKGHKRWHELITSRITDTVKLVGPTISCEGSPKDGNVNGEWRTNPHVQSYVLATDQIGYRLMREDGNVFTCYSNMWDTIFYSELGSSLAVLKGGYNLDSFMVRYQGVDWTDQSSWECNGRVNPYGENYYDGISLNPFEVMFVKVKGVLLQNDWSYARVAKKYDEWMTMQEAHGHSDVVSNLWKTNPWPLKAPRIAYMRARGSQCFDVEYYRTHNKDLTQITDPFQLWEHFVTLGEFEGRPFRFTCENPIT